MTAQSDSGKAVFLVVWKEFLPLTKPHPPQVLPPNLQEFLSLELTILSE